MIIGISLSYASMEDSEIKDRVSIIMDSYKPVNAEFDAYLNEIDHLEAEVAAQKPILGYPLNCHNLKPLLSLRVSLHRDFTLNNCGDPLDNVEKPYKLNTLKQEGRLITTLMKRWNGTLDNSWGYITTGGTEGVTRGIALGYERLQSHGFSNILVIYSKASHYSVPKAASLVAPSCNKVSVGVTDTNDINLEELDDVLHSAKILNVEAILICCTLGTTFFGGCDDVDGVRSLLIKNGYENSNSSYIHLDAALHGGFWQEDENTKKYQIGKDFDSISISGHKWFGGFVAGCFLATREERDDTSTHKPYIEYVGMVDKFISGSRSGAPAVLWTARLLQFDWNAELDRCHSNRDYLVGELRRLGLKVAYQYINVLMPRPSEELAKKWQLMCVGDEAQVLVLPHASRQYLKEFVEDVRLDFIAEAIRPPTGRLERLAQNYEAKVEAA